MKKLIVSYILGFLAFMTSFFLIVSLPLSVIGLVLGILAAKKSQKITIPFGVSTKSAGKTTKYQPFLSSKLLAYLAIGLNVFALLGSFIFGVPALLTAIFTLSSNPK